jgi:hypothetical protein
MRRVQSIAELYFCCFYIKKKKKDSKPEEEVHLCGTHKESQCEKEEREQKKKNRRGEAEHIPPAEPHRAPL